MPNMRFRGRENTMHSILKRSAALIASAATLLGGGMLMAGTAQADGIGLPVMTIHPAASTSYPKELVNGGFQTFGNQIVDKRSGGWQYLSFVDGNGMAMEGSSERPWAKVDGWDAVKFGWKSNDSVSGHSGIVEVQRFRTAVKGSTGNVWGEIAAATQGKYLYQDIDTANTSDAMYTVRLKHASRNKDARDSMQVLVGAPGREKPVTMRRTIANAGDKAGEESTTITSTGTGQDDQWDTYEGTVLVPRGQDVTRFTFKSVADSNSAGRPDSAEGNLIDDVVFTKAYQLTYDANGGTKAKASQISSMTEGKASETDGKVKTVADDAAGSIPSNETAGAVKQAKSKTNGSVRLTADDDVAEYAANGLPDHLVNGDFSYPSFSDIQENEQETDADLRTFLKSDDGTLWCNMSTTDLSKYGKIGQIPGFDSSRFAWSSTENGSRVELQQDRNTKNTYAEIVAQQDNTSIYQNVSTGNGGVLYKIRLKHASRQSSHADRMQVLVGSDTAHATPVEMTRVTSNGHGDKVGGKSTTITTKVSNTDPRDHGSQWETYEGYYQVPEGQKNTVFMFKSLEGFKECETLPGNNVGNLVDDIEFSRSYRLGYDGNGGTGQVPSRTETGRTETAASGTDGTVRLAADKSAEPESGTIADDRRVLTDTTARQDDGTSQRTITRSDGSVRVETIADTGAVSGCQVYYPAGAKITLATAKADSDCWDSSQISKTNRTFYGWSANTDANDKDVPVADTMDRATLDANAETQITMPARAKTVYALWAINPTLTYNVNAPATTKAPDAPASMTVPYNTAADDKSGWTVGDTGKITGYSFDGWYTSPTGGDKYDWSTKLTNDVTMYAHWTANGYTVKYDAGGGKGTMGDQKFTFDVPQNLSPNAFTRDGYTFTGWKRADTGDSYTDGQQVSNLTSTPNGIVTMIAQWTPNPASINYDPNPPTGRTPGGQGTANWTGHTGDTQAIGANGWTVDGYTFIGWNTSADGKGTAYAPGTTWTANGTLTLYAQWTPGQAGLTYDGNGATGGKTDPQPGKTDEKINVRDNGFTRDGYMFVTWNTQADCKGKAVDPGDEWTLQGSGTLYACWAGTAQTLAYHGNGATGGNTAVQSGKTGDELTTNANGFTRDGYTFVRWDTAKDGSGTAYGEGKNGVSQYTMKPAGNDLYAIWKANPASIVYRNGYPNTTGSTPDTTGSTGDTVTVSQNGFDRPGYTFTGWSTSKRGDPSLNPGDKHTLEPGTTTVWAQWKANPAHLVYNSNVGGIGSETRTVDGVVDQTVKTLGNPFDRPGYTFSGWNTQADGKGKAYDPGADCTLTANDKSTPKNTSVLYAQWTINKVTLKFDPNGGVGGYPSINTDAFGSVTIPKDAKEPKVTRPGFRFTGWSLKKTPDKDETLLTPGKDTVSMPAEGEVAVYAQWEPAMTTLPFTGGNAQIPTIWLWAGLAFLIIAAGAFSPMIRLRMGAGSKGRHAGTPTIGRHSR